MGKLTPEEKEHFIHDLFTRIAPRYDAMNILMTAGRYRAWQRRFRQIAALKGDEKVLDVGTGTGDLCLLLAPDLNRGGHIEGVDLTEKMLALAEKKVAASPFASRITLTHGNALHMPYADDSFDLVVSAFALRNFADLDKALLEMHRVTRPGGRVLLMELTQPPSPWVRKPYRFYFSRIVPFLGLGLPKDGPYAPYQWLPVSQTLHPGAPEMGRLMVKAGWTGVRYLYLTLGLVAIHEGRKPAERSTANGTGDPGL
ncbi:MAG: ubiquinone/menaquinone biosynthesis methyltransferase [Bacillota bacterium]|nr:ubiquinone/menaquinone biosynthesis methyltransferase [Bacillota bacterium]